MEPDALPSLSHTEERSTRHLVSVALEDYFQVGAFNRLIQRGQWYRFETRLEHGTRKTLELLDAYGVRATFFVLGWVAEQLPELIREVAAQGHEIASKGYYHRSVRQMTPSEFREDLSRAKEALERAAGQRVVGYRVADEWFTPADLWALDLLAEEGYEYDSSIAPIFRRFAAEPWRRFAHPHLFGDRVMWEFPISTAEVFGLGIPIAGGNYFRQLPHALVRRAVERWTQTYAAPYVMYFHTWELDPSQPVIQAAPWLQRIRQYRGLARMPHILEYYFERYRFTGMADYLGISVTPTQTQDLWEQPALPAIDVAEPPVAESDGLPVTVVIPCYNEELILPYLANTLRSVEAQLGGRYDLHYMFVDDGSTDDTWGSLENHFGDHPRAKRIRHRQNQGVAQGILTGIRAAETEIVCSIDCDCTYDPHLLGPMIELLTGDVDLVTASPYHPKGQVRNVPRWRLVLSRSLSRLYRLVLHHRLATYTSCFRVYRRDRVATIALSRQGFLGVAELLGRLDLTGGTIVEYPATLEVRMLGRSKMRVLNTIVGHLGLLASFAWSRVGGRAPAPRPQPDIDVAPSPSRADAKRV